ncbi:hypothetical protein VPH49_21840 [Pseudomonas luteola]|uniref:hypothetical protein n=1 Tax=Pseudomonas luteola TaxID=47886 RepID=UPI003A835356
MSQPHPIQPILKRIADHLATQRERSSNGIHCQYRDPYGNKCAVGALIPDEIYREDMESTSIAGLLNVDDHLREYLCSLAPGASPYRVESALIHAQHYHDGYLYGYDIQEAKALSDEQFSDFIMAKHFAELMQ